MQGELKYGYELFHSNVSCVPLWTVHELNEKHAGCMMWPGSDFPYRGRHCSHYQRLDEKMSWRRRTAKVMSWIKDIERPAKLIMWYMEQPDSDAHAYGPMSQPVKDMIAQVDRFVGELQREISRNDLDDRVNLIILSDHGMITVPLSNIIDLHQLLTPGTYKLVGTSPVIQVIPNEGQRDAIWQQLSTAAAAPDSHFDAYTNANVPERWHVHHNRRLIIWAVAKLNYAFPDLLDLAKWFEINRNVSGNRRLK